MMVAGTAAAVGLALANDRKAPRWGPVLVEAAPNDAYALPQAAASEAIRDASPRDQLVRWLGIATLVGVAVMLLVATVPALTTFASSLRSTPSIAPSYGPPAEMRAAAGIGGNWEESRTLAAPSAGMLGAALLAGIEDQHRWDVLKAMRTLADEKAAAAGDAEAAARVRAAAPPYSMNAPSGLAAGTVMRARITIYGCTGPGGGFCNNMSSGGTVFEGAAACSSDLPFGTRLTIAGDPTGRVYECLDRGALPATWIDVYFENTGDGIAWASQLGGTSADITIVN